MANDTQFKVLFEGYSFEGTNSNTYANCTSSLLTGEKNVIIDTMTSWDGYELKLKLKENNLECEDIDYVVCTHCHSDHVGCNYLFSNATHIVGYAISHRNNYQNFDFTQKTEYKINEFIRIIPTPGHTMQDVSVIANIRNMGKVCIVGDLFEREEDIFDENIWMSVGSDAPDLQRQNRNNILNLADWIVPGHGPMFKVKKEYRKKY